MTKVTLPRYKSTKRSKNRMLSTGASALLALALVIFQIQNASAYTIGTGNTAGFWTFATIGGREYSTAIPSKNTDSSYSTTDYEGLYQVILTCSFDNYVSGYWTFHFDNSTYDTSANSIVAGATENAFYLQELYGLGAVIHTVANGTTYASRDYVIRLTECREFTLIVSVQLRKKITVDWYPHFDNTMANAQINSLTMSAQGDAIHDMEQMLSIIATNTDPSVYTTVLNNIKNNTQYLHSDLTAILDKLDDLLDAVDVQTQVITTGFDTIHNDLTTKVDDYVIDPFNDYNFYFSDIVQDPRSQQTKTDMSTALNRITQMNNQFLDTFFFTDTAYSIIPIFMILLLVVLAFVR